VVSGYTGAQTFDTSGSGSGASDQFCGNVLGGASQWFNIVPLESGTLYLSTSNSTYDTVMGLFRTSLINPAVLQLLTCDDNGGPNRTSSLGFPVQAGVTYYILVDGVGGATGRLQLNYSLVTTSILKPLGKDDQGLQHIQITGRTNLHYILQGSTNLRNWVSVLTSNAPAGVSEVVDPGSRDLPARFYRAVLLP